MQPTHVAVEQRSSLLRGVEQVVGQLAETPSEGRHVPCREKPVEPSPVTQLVGTRSTMDARLDKRPLVLVVDDDARSASLLARLLRADGYDTEVTVDGAAALARLTRDPVPEAVVTDFHLPHADGLAVGRYARSRRAGIPIFVVTGYPQSLEKAAQCADESIELLTKPLDYADLLRRLATALGSVRVP
jgi:CheY-like chemotaxis protein